VLLSDEDCRNCNKVVKKPALPVTTIRDMLISKTKNYHTAKIGKKLSPPPRKNDSHLPLDQVSLSKRKRLKLNPPLALPLPKIEGPLGPVIIDQARLLVGLGGFSPADKKLPTWFGSTEQKKQPPLDFSWGGVSNSEFGKRCSEFEEKLSDPKAVIEKRFRLGGGVNATYVVTLSNGLVGIWKPEPRENRLPMRRQVPGGGNGRREAAAYEVDKMMGHTARIPPAVYREFNGVKGGLQLLVPDVSPGEDFGAEYEFLENADNPVYKRLAVFDHTIGNLDRHGRNWLFDPQGHVIPIDHGLSFPVKNSAQGGSNFAFQKPAVLDDSNRESLSRLLRNRAELEGRLEGLLPSRSVEAMFTRVDRMLATGTTSDQWRDDGIIPGLEDVISFVGEVKRKIS